MLRAESVAIKMEWIKAIRDALRFREMAMKSKNALASGDYVSALKLVAEAREVSGFEQNFVTALQWAQIAEMSKETTRDGANGVLRTLEFRQLHSGPITCLASTHRTDRKRYVITGAQDKLVVLWDMNSGEIVREMKGHSVSVKSVAISEVGTAVSGGTDGTLHAWDLETGKCLWFSRRRDGHKEAIAAVAITPDGDWAVSGSWDKLLTVWSMSQGRAVMRLMGHKRAITAVCIAKGGRVAISGGVDTRVMVWDLKKQKRVLQFKNHGFGIRALAVGPNLHAKSSEDDLIVVSGDDRGAVMVWTLNDGEVLTCLLEDTDDGEERNAVNAIDISPDGTTVIIATEDRTIRVFDLRSQKLLASAVLESVDEEITNLSICGNGGVFAAAHEDRLDLWTVDWILKSKGSIFGVRNTSSRKFLSGKNKK